MHIAKLALIAALAFAQAVAAETPSAMLEKGIFQQETAGDLDAAEKTYQQIVDAADAKTPRHTVAEAQYRLAVCYQSQGKKDAALAAFGDLAAKYSDEKELIARARKELGEPEPAPAPKYDPLQLDPVPWPDNELMVLSVKSKSGTDLGTVFLTARRLDSAGKPDSPALSPPDLRGANPKDDAWRLEVYEIIPMTNWREYMGADVDAITLAPMTSRLKYPLGDFRTAYRPGKISLEATHGGKPTTLDISVAGTVYSNEEVLCLLRRLPFKEGYTARFPAFLCEAGTVDEYRIRVEGREEVENTPCWKVALSIFFMGEEKRRYQCWVEAEGARRLIKYDVGPAVMTLTSDYPAPGRRLDIEGIFSIALPPGWFAESGHVMPFSLHLLPPQLKAWAIFLGKPRTADADARSFADADVASQNSLLKNYAVRADSWADVTVSGFKGVRFVADYQDKELPMVEYRTYLLTPNLVAWFVFQIEKDRFDKERPEFDQIMESLQPGASADGGKAK